MSDHSVIASDQHVQAVWNGTVIADSSATIVVERNHYFPREHVDPAVLAGSSEHTWCPWKGEASYFDIVVDGQTNPGGAWYYPEPMDEAVAIKDYVAFWRGVEVTTV
jgi:uncharacterized protein (DUF427 family)